MSDAAASGKQVESADKPAIRFATPNDVPAIVSITNAAFAVETFLDGDRTDEEGVREMMRSGNFLVALESPERIVASVYVELRGEQGYFGMLAVDPRKQGRGIGRAMIEAAENYFREQGCKESEITVLSLRTELPPLYHKFGYAESGTREFRPARPLRPGIECHIIVMTKALARTASR